MMNSDIDNLFLDQIGCYEDMWPSVTIVTSSSSPFLQKTLQTCQSAQELQIIDETHHKILIG